MVFGVEAEPPTASGGSFEVWSCEGTLSEESPSHPSREPTAKVPNPTSHPKLLIECATAFPPLRPCAPTMPEQLSAPCSYRMNPLCHPNDRVARLTPARNLAQIEPRRQILARAQRGAEHVISSLATSAAVDQVTCNGRWRRSSASLSTPCAPGTTQI